MTQTAYAKYRGVSRQHITKLVAEGKIPTQDGKIDRDLADQALADNRHPGRDHTRKGNAPLPESPPTTEQKGEKITYALARTQKEHYLAKKAKLDYERELGLVLRRSDVEKASFETARRIRDHLQAIPNRVAGLVAAETNQDRCFEILTKEIHQALEELSRYE